MGCKKTQTEFLLNKFKEKKTKQKLASEKTCSLLDNLKTKTQKNKHWLSGVRAIDTFKEKKN